MTLNQWIIALFVLFIIVFAVYDKVDEHCKTKYSPDSNPTFMLGFIGLVAGAVSLILFVYKLIVLVFNS